MHTLKRGTALVKQFRLVGIDLNKELLSIEFMFKARKAERAPTLLYKKYHKKYPGDDVTFDSSLGVCSVSFSEEDTRALRANESVFMDTRIQYADGTIPESVIKEFFIAETLFPEEVTDSGR